MPINEIIDTNFNSRGSLSVYGPGTDGDVFITGTVVLNRDMYYNNLTVLGSAQLDTNGYRVFVKDTLNMADASSVIGRLSDKTSAGSILGGAPSGVKASDTLGGNGGLNEGENFFGEAEFYNFSQAIAGYKFDAVEGTLRFLMGGSGGAIGESGSAGQSGSFTLGEAGQSGSAGQPGTRPGFEYTVGASGGMGYPGSPGETGQPGIGGSGGPGGLGGDGGAGGGVVIISARNIIGSGIIRADGDSGSPGLFGGFGGAGSQGDQGAQGAPGAPAPDFYSASYTYVSQPAYNYAVEYSFTNPTTGGTEYTTYNAATFPGYTFQTYSGVTYIYNRPTTTYNRPSSGTNPGYSYYIPNRKGPASVRWRSARTVYVPGNPYTIPGTARTSPGNFAYIIVNFQPAFGYYTVPGNAVTAYNEIVPGNTSYAYNYALQPDQYSIEPAQYFAGGAGGAGGLGGAGGIGSSGLPGSPGLNGYAGGGGVVLVITEQDIPEEIEVRAAAGTGDGGMATSGTVVIIKNEAVDDAN